MMHKMFQWLKQKRLPLLAGFLVGTTYIPFPPWALLFCYVPLWLYLLDTKFLKTAFWGAWLTQFTLTVIGFHWVAYTAKEFGSLPWSIAIVTVLLFAALIHLYIPLSVALAMWLRKRFTLSNAATLLTLAILHSLAERFWPSIFPWTLGYTLLWAKIPAYQWADVIGFDGLSSVILLFNAWVAFIWLQYREAKASAKSGAQKSTFAHISALVVLCIVLTFAGEVHKKPWDSFDSELKASVVQANIGNIEKVFAEQGRAYQDNIIEKFSRLSAAAVAQTPDTQLLIWPETAYPDYLDAPFLGRRRQLLLTDQLRNINKPLLTGAYSKEETLDIREDRATYNALFLIKPTGEGFSPPYRKTYLLAFGEYLPFSDYFPVLLKWMPFISNFGRGPGPSVLHFVTNDGAQIPLGAQICYEGLYEDFSRGLSQKGAEVLVNVTNDSWFGYPSEPRQHLYMTLARAIETRRPLIRSTNTGISTAILANGEVLPQSPLHEEWFGTYKVFYKNNPPQTFFVNYGHWDWVLLLILLIGTLIAGKNYVPARRP